MVAATQYYFGVAYLGYVEIFLQDALLRFCKFFGYVLTRTLFIYDFTPFTISNYQQASLNIYDQFSSSVFGPNSPMLSGCVITFCIIFQVITQKIILSSRPRPNCVLESNNLGYNASLSLAMAKFLNEVIKPT